MTKQFFITGLPRSRTAWFANLFTWGDSFCWHDGLINNIGHQRSIETFVSMLRNPGFERIGHSCASNLMFWRTLVDAFPKSRWIIIDRDASEVMEACKIFGSVKPERVIEMSAAMDDLSEWVEDRMMRVTVEQICVNKCLEMSKFLNVDIGPIERVRQLLDMNVQIHPPVLKRRLESLKMSTIVDTKEAA